MAVALQLTTQEARTVFAGNVDKWITFMRENRLGHGVFRIDSADLLGPRTMFEVGAHCDLFTARGCEVISHSVAMLRGPGGDEKTITSLLVRAPKLED
jgi:hypothetical protein